MKTIIYTLMISVVLVFGCSSTHYVTMDNSQKFFNKINKKAARKHALITLANEQKVQSKFLEIRIDSTSWLEPTSQTKQIVPTSQIKQIYFIDHAKGLGQGCLSGLLIGGGGGVLAGHIEGKDYTDGYHGISMMSGAILGGGGGGLLSLAIGGAKGSSDKFVFHVNQQSELISKAYLTQQDSLIFKNAKPGKITISERVGEVIDLEERNKYHLFQNIEGFQSAVLFKISDDQYVFEITYLDESTGEQRVKKWAHTLSGILQIKDFIESFQ